MDKSSTKPSAIQNKGNLDWWTKINFIFIWFFTLALFCILIHTSRDFSKPYFNLILFGNYQLILIAFIVFLLLFRYIERIKINKIAEIRMKQAIELALRSNENILKALDDITSTLHISQGLDDQKISEVMKKINESENDIETAKKYLREY